MKFFGLRRPKGTGRPGTIGRHDGGQFAAFIPADARQQGTDWGIRARPKT